MDSPGLEWLTRELKMYVKSKIQPILLVETKPNTQSKNIFSYHFLLEEQESENWNWTNSTLNLQVIGQNQVCFDYLKY